MLDIFLSTILAVRPVPDSTEPGVSLELPPMSVIATRSQRPLSDVVGSVSLIGLEELEDQLIRGPADIARLHTDVTVPRSGTRFGYGGYSIRGVGGNRVSVEIDGIPVPDQFDIGSFSNSQRDVVDFSVLRRIEILRGPASTLYGSDALGGIVAYSTLRPSDLPGPIAIHSSHHTDDNARAATLVGKAESGNIGMIAALTQRSGEQLDAAVAGGGTDRYDFDSTSAFGKLVIDAAPNQHLTLTADQFERDSLSDITSILGSGRFSRTTGLFGDDRQERQRLSAGWEVDSDFTWLDSASVVAYSQESLTTQHTREERAASDIRRDRTFAFDQEVLGLRAHFTSATNMGGVFHNIGYGLDLRRTDTSEMRDALQTGLDGSNPTSVILGETFPVRDFPDSRTDEIGVYMHDEMALSQRWTAIAAVRFDSYRLTPRLDPIYLEDNPDQNITALRENAWSPKLGLLFDVSDASTAYMQWVRGFRAPPYADANIGLDIPLFNIRALPNPELRSETSDGVELGWRWDRGRTRLRTEIYYTRFDDFIETKARVGTDPQTGTLLFQSRNLDSTEIYGMQVELEHALSGATWLGEWADDLSVRLGAHINEGKNRVNGDGLNNLDPARLITSLNWAPGSLPLSVQLHATATDAKKDVVGDGLFIPDSYTTLDLTAQWRVSDHADLRIGAFNLTDEVYWRWSDVAGLDPDDPLIAQLAAPGRNAGLSFSYYW